MPLTKNHNSIWDACRKATEAAAKQEALTAARLQSAALELGGFTPTERGRWVTYCPHCQRKVELYSDNSGVAVVGYGTDEKCRAVPRITKWICDNGFRS